MGWGRGGRGEEEWMGHTLINTANADETRMARLGCNVFKAALLALRQPMETMCPVAPSNSLSPTHATVATRCIDIARRNEHADAE